MKKKRIFWAVIFVLLTVSAVVVITQQSETFSVGSFLGYCRSARPLWLVTAFVCMLGFIFFEGLAIRVIARGLGYSCPLPNAMAYSASDIFLSAITPSATGGQPACAYCMVRDGLPLAMTSVTLLLNLVMYTLSIVLLSVCSLVFFPSAFSAFGGVSKGLILAGVIIQMALTGGLLLLIFRGQTAIRLAGKGLHLLHRMHLIKNVEQRQEKLARLAQDYQACAASIRTHRRMLLPAFLCNLVQRTCTILVTVCVFLAVGGNWRQSLDVFATQSLVITGSNCIPIPGAVGVSDYLFLDSFGRFFHDPASIDLLTRGISFYICVCISAIVTWLWLLADKKKKKERTQ